MRLRLKIKCSQVYYHRTYVKQLSIYPPLLCVSWALLVAPLHNPGRMHKARSHPGNRNGMFFHRGGSCTRRTMVAGKTPCPPYSSLSSTLVSCSRRSSSEAILRPLRRWRWCQWCSLVGKGVVVVFDAVKTPRRSANGMLLGFHSSRRATIHMEWTAYMHGITQASIETPRTTLMTIAASLPCWLSLRPTPYPALPSLMPPAEQRNTVSLTFSKNIERISCATSGETQKQSIGFCASAQGKQEWRSS
jgi:hypothetical protein